MLRILQIISMAIFMGLASMPIYAYDGGGALTAIAATELPKEGRETLALIRRGGPYPFAKDGTIFSNRERVLPKHPRGYYHEYTVRTPGARDRGARRIICGGKQQLNCYYTADHYASFKAIRE